MSHVVHVEGLTKRYGSVTALDDVGFSITRGSIVGLLGRNGAGKTTLLQILSAQGFESGGRVEVFGEHPYENERVLSRICFIKESQKYPDAFTVRNVLDAARLMYRDWDEAFAQSLLEDFDLPPRRRVKKLSRGMLSALGVIVGLASRAPLTFFDEPYLGLDAVARHLFYDRLLQDYADNPRTIVLSTHLIDEVADLLEHVLLIDRGRLVVDQDADTLRESAVTVTGPTDNVARFTVAHDKLQHEQLGSAFSRVTVTGGLEAGERAKADELGLAVEAVSLQQLVVLTTGQPSRAPETSEETR
jgi:ABC-2 type transport system ATP-binding protein